MISSPTWDIHDTKTVNSLMSAMMDPAPFTRPHIFKNGNRQYLAILCVSRNKRRKNSPFAIRINRIVKTPFNGVKSSYRNDHLRQSQSKVVFWRNLTDAGFHFPLSNHKVDEETKRMTWKFPAFKICVRVFTSSSSHLNATAWDHGIVFPVRLISKQLSFHFFIFVRILISFFNQNAEKGWVSKLNLLWVVSLRDSLLQLDSCEPSDAQLWHLQWIWQRSEVQCDWLFLGSLVGVVAAVVARMAALSTPKTLRSGEAQRTSGHIRMVILWVKERETAVVVRESRLVEEGFLIPVRSNGFDCYWTKVWLLEQSIDDLKDSEWRELHKRSLLDHQNARELGRTYGCMTKERLARMMLLECEICGDWTFREWGRKNSWKDIKPSNHFERRIQNFNGWIALNRKRA
jgi:hypothetical protein